jgi:hypothetical protein
MRGRIIVGVWLAWCTAACRKSASSTPDAAPDGAGSDDVSAGLLDVADFPPEWRGPSYMGGPSGTYSATTGLFIGTTVTFLPLPFATVPGGALDVGPTGLGGHGHTPPAYRFDVGSSSHCAAPPAQQGDIFTLVPDGPDYVPIVAEVPVTSHGETCDAIKSEATLLTRTDVTVGNADGVYRLAPILDPRAATVILPPGYTGPGVPIQQGWFDRYQLAYIDGPAVPLISVATKTEILAQILYVPDEVPDGMGGLAPGTVDSGFAIFQFSKTSTGYSPICHVLHFTPTDPSNLPTSFAGVSPQQVDPDQGEYIICMQL